MIIILGFILILTAITFLITNQIIKYNDYKDFKPKVEQKIDYLAKLQKDYPFTFNDTTYSIPTTFYNSDKVDGTMRTIVDHYFNEIQYIQINLIKNSVSNSQYDINIFKNKGTDFRNRVSFELISDEELNDKINNSLVTEQLIVANKLDKKLLSENIELKSESTKITETDKEIIYTGVTSDGKILTFTYNKNSNESKDINIEINSENFVIK